MNYIIENEQLRVTVAEHGAEVISVINKANGRECVWNADASWWKRCTPVLFPIVGNLWNKTMRVDGKEYHMSQHGFARDVDFEMVEKTETSVVFSLHANAETMEKYPFRFELQMCHTLEGNKLTTKWTVINPSDKVLPFQIGGHPAYRIPDITEDSDISGHITLKGSGDYRLTEIGEGGCVKAGDVPFQTNEIDIRRDTFAKNALIFETPVPQEMDLYDRHHNHILTFYSPSPSLGIWAPVKDVYAPFVCLEPWWGRTDRENYMGDFYHREYMNLLTAHCSMSGEWAVAIFA